LRAHAREAEDVGTNHESALVGQEKAIIDIHGL